MRSRLLVCFAALSLLVALLSPARARAMDPAARTVIRTAAYGAAGGTLVGVVLWPVAGSFRGVFIGTSVGLYLGLLVGIYQVTHHDQYGGPRSAGLLGDPAAGEPGSRLLTDAVSERSRERSARAALLEVPVYRF